MRHKITTISALILLASVASAAPPVAIINGPSQCANTPGIVILDSTGTIGDNQKWNATDAQVFLGQNGQVAIIYQKNTAEVVFVTLATASVVNNQGVPAVASHPIQFGASPNPPGPDPGPNPPGPGPVPPGPGPTPPTPPAPPVIPDGTYGLAKIAYGLASALPAASKANASKVAACLTTNANQCIAGAYADVFAAGDQLDKDIGTALGADNANWGTVLDPKDKNSLWYAFNYLYTTGKINSFAEMATAEKEMAIGISAAGPSTRDWTAARPWR